METLPLISVIVPVYKVEAYLDKCILSIVDQTYTNLEIILVDDGSPDCCGQICDVWAEKDSRIKVIHKENGGLSDARNAGMAVATGDWIAFVDSDDWIGVEMYEVLLNAAHKTNAQIAVCGVKRFYDKCEAANGVKEETITVLDKIEAMRELIRDGRVQQIATNKIFRADQVKHTHFPTGKYHEDEFWTYQIIAKSARITIVDYVGYYYFQRRGSIMGQTFSIKRLDAVEAKCLRHLFVTTDMPVLINDSLNSLWGTCLYQGQCALHFLKNEDCNDVLRYLRNVQRRFPLPKRRPPQISRKYWVWYCLAERSLRAVCEIRNLLRIGV